MVAIRRPVHLSWAGKDHRSLPQDPSDTNIYTLGCMGEHNVVVACLPAGQTGNNSAAAVAVQMKSKFISIRFGLMVGIGGGVPSDEADVRLGDVVISQPYVQHVLGLQLGGPFVKDKDPENVPLPFRELAVEELPPGFGFDEYGLLVLEKYAVTLPESRETNAAELPLEGGYPGVLSQRKRGAEGGEGSGWGEGVGGWGKDERCEHYFFVSPSTTRSRPAWPPLELHRQRGSLN